MVPQTNNMCLMYVDPEEGYGGWIQVLTPPPPPYGGWIQVLTPPFPLIQEHSKGSPTSIQCWAIFRPPAKHLVLSPWTNNLDPRMQSFNMLAFVSLRVLQECEFLRNVPLNTGTWTSVFPPPHPLQKCWTPTLIFQNGSSSLNIFSFKKCFISI